jgi:K+-transporting ATPase ATPase C chain
MNEPRVHDAAPALSPGTLLAAIGAQLRPSLAGALVLTLLTGALYPAAIYALARLTPSKADGGLIVRNGVIVGSALIGQAFATPRYFHPRPSAAGAGYDGAQSGGSNLAPRNPKLAASVQDAAQRFRRENGLAPDGPIPVDAVTSSGSGVDPDISPQNAELQAARVAHARSLALADVRSLVRRSTKGRQFGVLGEPRVSVLALNLALDQFSSRRQR